MPVELAFAPDPVRARALDGLMHRELRSSLEYLASAAQPLVALDPRVLQPLLGRIDAGLVQTPATFARYYALVAALEADDAPAALSLFEELAAAAPAEPGLAILPLNDAALSADAERYTRLMNEDGASELTFVPPDPEIVAAFTARLRRGMALLDDALPALAGEIRALLRQIVIAQGDPSRRLQFDGGSHFQLWGALFLNGRYHPDALAVAEVLAHEAGHCLLFGFSTQEPLVENPDDELYASPLRPDPRPMDGIFHAAFVSARMHWAMDRLSRSASLGTDDQARAAESAVADMDNFRTGLGVIEDHGLLTSTGRGLLEGACRYMESVGL